MPKPCRVPHQGEFLTLRELAAATGINPATIMKRWTEGDRGERLIRPIDPRAIRAAQKLKPPCQINSLLAGWKSVPSAPEVHAGSGQPAGTE